MNIVKRPHYFPKTIKGYTYVKPLAGIAEKSVYSLAIYKKGRDLAVCKLWHDSGSTQNKKWLINEINSYLTLIKATKNVGKEFSEISIPKIINFKIEKDLVYILMQKVDGALLSSFDKKISVNTYELLLSYFQRLNQEIKSNDYKVIKRGNLEMFFFFTIYSLKALLTQKYSLYILQAMVSFYKNAPTFLSDNKLSFVHRDLGGYNNVIVNGKSLKIIDFQISSFSHPLVEIANIITTKWNDQKFISLFTQTSSFKNIVAKKNNKIILQSLLLYGAIFDLATGVGKQPAESIGQIKFAQIL